MADFLASFNFRSDDDIATNDGACVSVAELQQRLQDIIDAKTTDIRAEYITATLEVAGTVQFYVAVSNTLNDAHSQVEPPLLDGDVTQNDSGNEHQTKPFKATDALRNQPNSSPSIQQAIAEQIIAAVSAADNSTWVLQGSDLRSHGWDFTFVCDGSMQQWSLQNEGMTKALLETVGEYTKKEPDPILMGRPAFDCRGRISISFSRKGRSISVKYNHIALHKTVGELAEFAKPPPMIGPQKPDKQTLDMAIKKAANEAAKAKRKTNRENKEKGTREGRLKEKKPKKSKKAEQLPDQASQALRHNEVAQLQQAIAAEKEDSASAAEKGAAAASPSQEKVPGSKTLPLNVSPEEAVRRHDLATKLLTEAGVDLNSLSADQFTIFSNQAPEPQKESLKLLVTYGAERLQIIHPSIRESSTPTPASNTVEDGAADKNVSSAPQTTTTELVLYEEVPGSSVSKSRRPPGKSRLACYQCKCRRVKCPKNQPTCTECQAGSLTCEYPPQKPRKRNKKSKAGDDEAGEEADDEVDADGEPDDTVMIDGPQVDNTQQGFPQPNKGFQAETDAQYSYPQVPGADHGSEPTTDSVAGVQEMPTQLPYFQSASGLALPQPDPLDDPPRPGSTVYYPSYPLPAPVQEQQKEPEQTFPRNMATSARLRETPTESTDNNTASLWGKAQSKQMATDMAAHISPLLQHSRHHQAGSQSPDVGTVTPAQTMLHNGNLLAHAASHHSGYTPNSSVKMQRPISSQKSPFQHAYNPRSRSQHGHKVPNAAPQQQQARTDLSHLHAPTASNLQGNNNTRNSNNSNNSNNGVLNASTMSAGLPPALSENNSAVPADPANKIIGYRPYAQQRNTPTSSSYPAHQLGGTMTTGSITSAGTHPSLIAHVGLRPDHAGHVSSDRRHNQQNHQQTHLQSRQTQPQNSQNWQGPGNQGVGNFSNGHQQRQSYSWGMHGGTWSRDD